MQVAAPQTQNLLVSVLEPLAATIDAVDSKGVRFSSPLVSSKSVPCEAWPDSPMTQMATVSAVSAGNGFLLDHFSEHLRQVPALELLAATVDAVGSVSGRIMICNSGMAV